jgi:hypothetical protein
VPVGKLTTNDVLTRSVTQSGPAFCKSVEIPRLKGQVVPVHATKAYRRCRTRAPLILKFGTRWRWSSSSPCRFTPRKELWYSPKEWLGGPQSRSGRCEEQENFLPLPGFEPRNRPAHSWGYQSTLQTRLTKQPNNIPPCSVQEPKFLTK